MELNVTAKVTTVVKYRLTDASTLQRGEFSGLGKNESIKIDAQYATEIRKHLRFLPPDSEPLEGNFRYLYLGHIEITEEDGTKSQSFDAPKTIELDVPYRNQRNNSLNPDGSCNVTCKAMILAYYGIGQRHPETYEQFEDELYEEMEIRGWNRHVPEDLAMLSNDYGLRTKFDKEGSIAKCQQQLLDHNPVVIHGYFTNFGHIIVLKGFDEKGFIVHDPFGEWHRWGYDRNTFDQIKGKNLNYSYQLIQECCMPDGSLWMHSYKN
jgi:uncharacterized protein YvpB